MHLAPIFFELCLIMFVDLYIINHLASFIISKELQKSQLSISFL